MTAGTLLDRYVPGLPFLYGFMLTQRNKALSSGVFAKKVKTA